MRLGDRAIFPFDPGMANEPALPFQNTKADMYGQAPRSQKMKQHERLLHAKVDTVYPAKHSPDQPDNASYLGIPGGLNGGGHIDTTDEPG